MSEPIIRVETDRFHVTDANKLRQIVKKVCVYNNNRLELIENPDDSFSFAATEDILGYACDKDDPCEYDYRGFIEDLRTILPENEAVVIYTAYIRRKIEVEYTIITKYFYHNYALHNDVGHCLNNALSVKPFNYVYLVDLGVLENLEQTEDMYVVYDKKHGYYDECQYYEPVFENAKHASIEYVKQGCEGTYAVISESSHKIKSFGGENIYDSPVEDETYDTKSVIYSVAKIDGKIVENFIEKV